MFVRSGSSLSSKSARFVVEDSSHGGSVRRYAAGLAEELSFDETSAGRLSIVINELCTNLLKHAQKGEILLRSLQGGSAPSIEILCIDQGPGMTDIDQCMADGYTSGTSPGTGLGAIRRQSNYFDIYSRSGQGTVIGAWVQSNPEHQDGSSMDAKSIQCGVICLPIKGETECGDGWAYFLDEEKFAVIVSDGLGHGLLAHQASAVALEVFSAEREKPLELVMKVLHNNLRSTRGAAVSLAEISLSNPQVYFLGIGNVRGVVIHPEKMQSLISHSGTVGLQLRSGKVSTAAWGEGSLLILHSDGLTSRWDLNAYPGLRARHPSLIAAILYRDFCRHTDDVTIFVSGVL